MRRSVHTFKGAAGVVGFRTASQLAHHMEDVLDEIYEGNHPLTPQVQDLLLATFDALDEFIRSKGRISHFDATAQRLQNAYTTVWTDTPAEVITPVEAAIRADVAPAQSTPEPARVAASASQFTSPEAQPVAPVSESPPEQPGVEADVALHVHQIADVLRVHSTGRRPGAPGQRTGISRSAYEQHLGLLTHQVDNCVSVSSARDGRQQRLRRSRVRRLWSRPVRAAGCWRQHRPRDESVQLSGLRYSVDRMRVYLVAGQPRPPALLRWGRSRDVSAILTVTSPARDV